MENHFSDEIADIDTGMMVKNPMQVQFQQMIEMIDSWMFSVQSVANISFCHYACLDQPSAAHAAVATNWQIHHNFPRRSLHFPQVSHHPRRLHYCFWSWVPHPAWISGSI